MAIRGLCRLPELARIAMTQPSGFSLLDHARESLGSSLVTALTDLPPMPGVRLRALTVNRDPRGTLTELLRADWPDVYGTDSPFAQTYVSVTVPGIARDELQWHVHQHQTDRFVVLSGSIAVAIADARPDSPTQGVLAIVLLTAAPDAPAPFLLTVPPGTLHGLLAVGDQPAVLQNFPTRLWDASDEGRVAILGSGVKFPGGEAFSWESVRQALTVRG